MPNKNISKLQYAQRRVGQLKKFYNHLGLFVFINIILLMGKNTIIVLFFGKRALAYPEIMSWVYWNTFIWALIVAVHALLVFGQIPLLLKKWEERQIQKILDKEKYTREKLN